MAPDKDKEKDKPHYHGHRQRLRERMEENARGLADYELLELLLGYVLTRQDTKPLAKELLARFKTLRGVFGAGREELKSVPGFGPGLESFLKLWRELWARLHEAPVRERVVMTSPEAVAELAMARLGANRSEEFWVALLDNKNRLLAFERVSSGTVDQAPVYPREVLAKALAHEAAAMVLVHNHPGGDPRPSSQDLELTRRLVRAGTDLGVRVLDHVIVAESGYYSFQDKGHL